MPTSLPRPNNTADVFQRLSGGGSGGSGWGLSGTSEPGFKYDGSRISFGGRGCGLSETMLPGVGMDDGSAWLANCDTTDWSRCDNPTFSCGPPGSTRCCHGLYRS